MITESNSVALVSPLTVPSMPKIPSGYFRSKLFVNASTTSPLIAAASPLLSLLERLCVSPTLPAIDTIRDNIEHELYAFHSRLSSQHYADEFIMIAHYLLTATIDELLGKNYLRLYGRPAEFKAFTPPSHDDFGPQRRFFNIIHYIKERTTQYLDLLELSYYCLISGFEGEYHLRADGRQVLDNLIEELHQLIQQYRAHKTHRLFKDKPPITPEPINHKPFIATGLLVFSTLISIYFGSHSLLEHKAKTLIQNNAIFVDMDN